MKTSHREGKKTAGENIPTGETENLPYVGPITRKRARYLGDDEARVTLHDKSRKVNVAGTNISAAAGSTSLNPKRLHEDTENLACKAFNISSAAGGIISVKAKRPDTCHECPLDTRHDWQCFKLPPRPPEAGDDWQCFRVGILREDAKEEHNKDGLVMIKEDDYDFEYVWKKLRDPSDTFKIGTKKLSKAALEMRRMRFQMPWRPY